jgi:hypothetical protein
VDGDDDSVAGDSDCSGGAEKSTVGRLVRFIGEKVWGAWNWGTVPELLQLARSCRF